MATRAYVEVSREVVNLVTGLTEGARYVVQNVSSAPALHCNYATDPTAEGVDVGWHTLPGGEWITFEVDSSDPLWARSGSLQRKSLRLVISDG